MQNMANRHPRNCKKLTKEEISESINDGLSDVSSLEGQAEIDNEKISQNLGDDNGVMKIFL